MNVLDLGAGFGMHAVPLAQAGCSVTAVDSSALLLQELALHSHGLPLKVVEGDLLDCRRHVDVPQSPVLCIGDAFTATTSPNMCRANCWTFRAAPDLSALYRRAHFSGRGSSCFCWQRRSVGTSIDSSQLWKRY